MPTWLAALAETGVTPDANRSALFSIDGLPMRCTKNTLGGSGTTFNPGRKPCRKGSG